MRRTGAAGGNPEPGFGDCAGCARDQKGLYPDHTGDRKGDRRAV